MSKWWRQLQLELKLIFSNRFFLVLPVLFGAWMLHQLLNVPDYKPYNLILNAYDFHKLGHTMSLGAAMLLGILIIRRDTIPATYDWLGSWPVAPLMQVTAKFVAGWLYLSTFTLVMAAVFSGVGYHRGVTWSHIESALTQYVLQYEWSYAVTLALAMFLAAAIRPRIVYLIGFCAWMFGTFFMDIFLMSHSQLYFLRTFHLNQFTVDSLLSNDVWGWQLLSSEIWLSRLFVAMFTVMLIIWITVILVTRRPAQRETGWILCGVATILLSIATFLPYAQLWQERYAIHDAFVQESSIPIDSEEETRFQPGFAIQSYDIQLEQHHQNGLKGTATLTFLTADVAEQPSLYFTLNRLLKVIRVELNGKEVDFEREGDTLLIQPEVLDQQLEQQVMSIEYAGRLFLWGFNHYRETMHGFVQGKHVFLPAHLAWYPLPGKRPLFNLGFFTKNDKPAYYLRAPEPIQLDFLGLNPVPSEYTITLSQFEGDVFTTAADKVIRDPQNHVQQFYIAEAEGVTLLGGNVTEIPAGQAFSVVSSPVYEGEINLFLEDMEHIEQYFSQWLEKMPNISRTIFYLPFGTLGVGRYYAAPVEVWDDAFIFREDMQPGFIDDARYERERLYMIKDMIYYRLFKDDDVRGYIDHESIAGAILDAFYYLYLKDGLKLSNEELMLWIQPYLEGPPDTEDSYDHHTLVTKMVVDALRQGKTNELKHILQYFYTRIVSADSETPYPVIKLEEWQQQWKQVMGE
ncbi:hypothetical protein GCM10010965_01210 [Caldalkalibacillus thermarum]|uniref:hypothetical protein n=1 Tax=Caldalkalibacillus thermarum TaxID=296745 RepID=UPI0016641D90|nr:hypothetical protein [Caldalkalibacillus thermarum]GGK12002.1 hypothetical protein GCM10010965_01210 [Caldalkalibacillus thermarum]